MFQEFVNSSDLKVYEPVRQTGHFRQLTARSSQEQLMLIVGIHPQSLTPEQLAQLKDELKKFFFEGEGKRAGVTSLHYKAIIKK